MKNHLIFLSLLLAAVSFTSCCKKAPVAEHVIMLTIDGMSSADFNPEELPTLKALMDEGCWTLQKRSVVPSVSAVNWASMFMGVGTEIHGYTTWGSQVPEIEPRAVNERGINPTIFSILREQRPESVISCLYEWDNIGNLIDKDVADRAEEAAGYKEDSELLCRMAEESVLSDKPSLLLVCWDQVDHAGHVYGWGSPEYMESVRKMDEYCGRIIEKTKEAGIYENTVFLVTADHGGIEYGHGGYTLNEMETPFIIAGKGIRKGGQFSESMAQYDVPAMVARIFRLALPQVWRGQAIESVFE